MDENKVPITKDRIQICLESAELWADELPRYANDRQRRADICAIVAGLASAVAGLSVWPTLSGETPNLAFESILVSSLALVAAAAALFPRIKNYGEQAGQAREITSQYGSILGALKDLSATPSFDQAEARRVIDLFQAAKQKKDALRDLPDKDRIRAERARVERQLITIKLDLALAKKTLAEASGGSLAGPAAPAAPVKPAPEPNGSPREPTTEESDWFIVTGRSR